MQLFPFHLHAYDNGHYCHSPELAQAVWMRIRDCTWYGVGCEVISENSIVLHVHEMADSFSGGLGRVIKEVPVSSFTGKELAMLRMAIENQATKLAEEEFERLEAESVRKQIIALRKKLFNI